MVSLPPAPTRSKDLVANNFPNSQIGLQPDSPSIRSVPPFGKGGLGHQTQVKELEGLSIRKKFLYINWLQ